jgi:hypothetical protein
MLYSSFADDGEAISKGNVMSRGKYLSFEEARKSEALGRFAKEHPMESDRDRFERLLDAISQGVLEEAETSRPDRRACSNETRTRLGT